MAEGSGVNKIWLYFLNSVYDFGALFNGVFRFLGCSAFVYPQKDGEHVIIGKTTDIIQVDYFTKELIKSRLYLNYRIGDSNLVETVTFAGQIVSDFAILNRSIFVGFNDGGLETKKNYPTNSLIQSVLFELFKKEKTFEAAVDYLLKARPIHPFIALVSDGTVAHTASIDMVPSGSFITEMDGRLIVTNFLLSEANRNRYYVKNWRTDKDYTSPVKRFERLNSSPEKYLDIDKAKKLLSSREQDADIYKGSVNNRATSDAVVWDPKTKKFFIPEGDCFPLLDTRKWLEF